MIAIPPFDGEGVTWELRTLDSDVLVQWVVPPGGHLLTRSDEQVAGGLVLWAVTCERAAPVWLRWESGGAWVAVLLYDGLLARPTLERGK